MSTIATDPVYQAYLNEHPYSCAMLAALNQYGVKGLLHPNVGSDLYRQQGKSYQDDLTGYAPTVNVDTPYPLTDFDFSYDGTYSIYNWEVFFHSVSLIARQLRQNNKYAEAIRWLNFIFDPGDTDTTYLDLRYWQVKPFMQNVTQGSIQNMMRLLSAATLSPADLKIRMQYEAQIAAWRRSPFDPHVIAGMRPRAYMLWTVMEYVTTLTDWGDYLFRQDSMESINEAINLYVLASEILGPRPRKVPRLGTPADRSFDDIEPQLSSFSNVLVEFEDRLSGLVLCKCYADNPNRRQPQGCGPSAEVTTVPTDLLFCVPDNPKLVEMWDRVEDRLFKIRHCMNIDGKRRELALFSPPIDPAMLVQAVAAGISIGDALADSVAPLPHYRFTYLLQKANEFTNEVKSLGSQLLGILEKKDAEELSLFRQVHEQNILKSAKALKQMAIEEAKQSYATLQSSKNLIQIRLDDYSARQYRNNREMSAMTLTRTADGFMYAEQGARLVAGIINLIPDPSVGTSGNGVHATAKLTGGQKLANGINAGANALTLVTSALRNKASQSLTFASYDRRQEDWELQKKTAREELQQVDRQLLGAQIRIAVTEKELANHDTQVAQSAEMYDWLKNKYTNGKLYSWMSGQVKSVYKQVFNLAYDMAKRAQVCYEYELGKSSANIIQYGQWDSSKSGLLAGERLSLQLKQLETEYIKNNEREYELSKNISLALLDSLALEDLRTKGSCEIYLPEMLFDLDHPSHYFRRIKSVSISIPCIAGPNTNINATLSLQYHGRRDTVPMGATTVTSLDPLISGYGESIATSSSQNDSGVFELNFKDERYVPFEGKGAVSKWKLELSQINKGTKNSIRAFDFDTIADVVMHIKYTAKEGGAVFAGKVADNIDTNLGITVDTLKDMSYSFSLKHDMPNIWNAFKQSANGSFSFTLEKSRLPYLVQAMNPKIKGFAVFTDSTQTSTSPKLSLTGTNAPLVLATSLTDDNLGLNAVSLPLPASYYSGSCTLTSVVNTGTPYTITTGTGISKTQINDLVIVVKLEVSW
jgi:hypothetical protein